MTRIALITGITGQDGSYLAELLLEKNYHVWGIIRRASNINTQRIDHLYHNKNLILKYGDMTDSCNLLHILSEIKEKYKDDLERLEIYNLAAMSHVKVSFEMPEYTGNVDGIGTLRLLEAIRSSGIQDKIRFYQASTSELYGKVQERPQTEKTPFYPRSPYGVAKLYGFWITKNYRESYGIFGCSGILHNHETAAAFMPVIFKEGNSDAIDIKPISEVVKYHTTNGCLVDESLNIYQEGDVEKELYIWDDNEWTRVTFASGYPHDIRKNNKKPRFIISKNAAYLTTSDHVIIMDDDSEKKTKRIKIGDTVKLINFPKGGSIDEYISNEKDNENCRYCEKTFSRTYRLRKHEKKCVKKFQFLNEDIDETEAEFLGVMVGDGYVGHTIQFTNKSMKNIDKVADLWMQICGRHAIDGSYRIDKSKSGFNANVYINQLYLTGFTDFFRKYIIYNEDRTKRVPKQVLNADENIKLSFLKGYNLADGLKANKCVYQFKNFKTNSAVLAQGLIYLIKTTTEQDFNINVEYVHKFNKDRMYYSINLMSDSGFSKNKSIEKMNIVTKMLKDGVSQREISRKTNISRKFIGQINGGYAPSGKHPKSVDGNSVKKIIELPNYDGWFYDLETESGKFHAGIGLGRIHNSPRRGPTFVTRKITRGLGMILRGETDRLVLGNLDAKRDWGHARDYVEGMWRILQADEPDDYVLATNEMHSVREFVEKSFALRGFDIKWKGTGLDEIGYDAKTGRELIFVSEKYFRPAEVEELWGCADKAKRELGWEPKTSFDELVKEMVDNDCP